MCHGSDASVLWRCWWIIKALRAHGYTADWRYFERFNAECKPLLYSGKYNMVVTPRYALKEQWMMDRWIHLVRDAGLVWVYESDDDLFSPEVVPLQAEFFFSLWPDAEHAGVEYELEWERQQRIGILGQVDAIIVSTAPLAAVVRQHTSQPVHVLPNAIDSGWFATRMRRRSRWIPPLTVGWSGGWRGIEDVQPVASAWSAIAERHPDVRFVVYGWDAPIFKSVISPDRLTVIPWGSLSKYPAGLRNIDIACCSVAATDWNRCKSPIKWYEATLAGSACVVSDAVYGEVVLDGVTGLVAQTPADWEYQIVQLIEHANLRRALNVQAREAINWQHDLQRHWSDWADTFQTILATRMVHEWVATP